MKNKFDRRQFLGLCSVWCALAAITTARKALTLNDSLTTSINLPTQGNFTANTSDRKNIRIVAISDLNSQYGSTEYEPEVDKAIALIPQFKPDLVLCGGDMIAGQKSSLSKSQIEAMWTAFDRHIAAPLRKYNLPFGFTIGNHDGSGAILNGQLKFQLDRQLAAAYWRKPIHKTGLKFIDRGNFPFYYSFIYDRLFCVVWDASNRQISSQQLNWIEQSLASNVARSAKMRIAIGHLPLYGIAVGRDKLGEYLDNAETLRSLLEHYRVHTYICGHDHVYFPGQKGQLKLLYTGALGSGPRQLLNSDLAPQKTLTVVDIDLDAETTIYTTYDIKTLTTVNHLSLPKMIPTSNGEVLRQDQISAS